MAMTREQALKVFGGVQGVRARVDSNYIRDGHYLARIDNIKLDQNRKSEAFLAVEMSIVHVFDDAAGEGHKVGENVSHLMCQKFELFLPNVKAMAANLLDMSPEEVDPDICVQLVEQPCPLAGQVAELVNRDIVTKKNSDFTIVNYKRLVDPSELKVILSPKVQAEFFPNDILGRMAAIQAQQERDGGAGAAVPA